MPSCDMRGCRLRGYQDINFGGGPPQGLTGHLSFQMALTIAVFPGPEGRLGLRMAVTPDMFVRLKASKVLGLLPHSAFAAC